MTKEINLDYKEEKMKRKFILFTTIAVLLLAFTSSCLPQHGNVQPINLKLTAEQWREDLQKLAEELPKRHKNAFHTMTREQFEVEVKQLNDEIPKLKNEEIFARFLKIISMVGDGHTSVEVVNFFGLGVYPVRYYMYQDGLFVQSAAPEYADVIGGKVIKIGNAPVEEALNKLKDVISHDRDNEMAVKMAIPFFLISTKVLHGLNIADDSEKISLIVEVDGQQKTVELKPISDIRSFFGNPKQVDASLNATNPKPLYLKDQRNQYWMEHLQDSKMLYVQFNEIQNKDDENIEAFFNKIFDFIDKNPVDKFVLDLRLNGGGNNFLNKPVVIGLIKSKINERGKFFVITGRQTFSAAQNLVNELEKYTNAIFVGEPTGNNPNQYGDPVTVTLPNSKLPVRISTLLWQDAGPRDKRKWTAPEIFTDITFNDYRNNIDPALQAVLNYTPGKTYKDLTAAAETNTDISVFITKYREFKSEPVNKFANTEVETNTFGYKLLQAKRITDAIEVFKLNVEAYPKSANAHDSLAEAYLANGNKAEAIKNYEKAVGIDPNFQSSVDALRRLKN